MRHRMRNNRVRRGGEEGVALIVVLVMVVLLTVLIVEFSYDTQVDASFAANSGDDFQAYIGAKSAVAQALGVLTEDAFAQLLEQDVPSGTGFQNLGNMDSVMEAWSTEGVPLGQVNEAAIRATISDEYGKINLNALFDINARLQNPDAEPVPNEAVMSMLLNFFIIYDAESEFEVPPEELVAAIMDWIDEDDDYTDYIGAEGAESDYYEASEIPYPAKNGQMDSIEELLLIRGFTPGVYFGDPEKEQLPLTEYLTVHGNPTGAINLNTAHPYVLDAAGVALQETGQVQMQGNLSEAVLNVRYAEGGFMAVTDLEAHQIVTAVQPIQPNQPSPGGPQPGGPLLALLEARFTVTGDTYRILADAIAGETKVRIQAYVYRNPFFFGQVAQDPSGATSFEGQIENEFGLAIPEEPYRILEWKVIR